MAKTVCSATYLFEGASMNNEVEHRHKRDGSSARTRTAAIVSVTGSLAIGGLCPVASAAVSGSGKADGSVMSRATRSSRVLRLDTCLPTRRFDRYVFLFAHALNDPT
jgi:hypothetical protein